MKKSVQLYDAISRMITLSRNQQNRMFDCLFYMCILCQNKHTGYILVDPESKPMTISVR